MTVSREIHPLVLMFRQLTADMVFGSVFGDRAPGERKQKAANPDVQAAAQAKRERKNAKRLAHR